MPLIFHPGPGAIVICDFSTGFQPPEMVKVRPVVVISPRRQVQRHIADLELAGFVRRIERRASNRGKISNEYDLSGLVEKLKALEPEFREAMEEAKARKKALVRPGLRIKRKVPAPAAAVG